MEGNKPGVEGGGLADQVSFALLINSSGTHNLLSHPAISLSLPPHTIPTRIKQNKKKKHHITIYEDLYNYQDATLTKDLSHAAQDIAIHRPVNTTMRLPLISLLISLFA